LDKWLDKQGITDFTAAHSVAGDHPNLPPGYAPGFCAYHVSYCPIYVVVQPIVPPSQQLLRRQRMKKGVGVGTLVWENPCIVPMTWADKQQMITP